MEEDIISGDSVTVYLPIKGEKDPLGDAETSYEVVLCQNVLASPSTTNDLDKTHPDGFRDVMTFHFPKEWKRSLKGAKIEYQEQLYTVIGDPQAYMESLTPGAWNRPVQGARIDG